MKFLIICALLSLVYIATCEEVEVKKTEKRGLRGLGLGHLGQGNGLGYGNAGYHNYLDAGRFLPSYYLGKPNAYADFPAYQGYYGLGGDRYDFGGHGFPGYYGPGNYGLNGFGYPPAISYSNSYPGHHGIGYGPKYGFY